jgi:hypothetical protein
MMRQWCRADSQENDHAQKVLVDGYRTGALRHLCRSPLVPDAVPVMKTTQQQAHQQNEHLL